MIDMNSNLKRNEEKYLSSDLGDETVIMDLETGSYVGLNSVGTDIWKAIEENPTPTKLVALLTKEYAVDESKCREDVLKYLQKLLDKKMILMG